MTLDLVRIVSADRRLKKSLKTIYCALVRSIVEYGSIVWNPQTAITTLIAQ